MHSSSSLFTAPWRKGAYLLLLALFASSLFSPTMTFAAESAAEDATVQSGLTVIDWAIIVIYALSTVGLGWYIGRRQKSTQEYFVGSGNMPPLLVGVSLFATLLSTITYLSMPGEVLGKGPVYLATITALPLVYIVVAYWIIPVYMTQQVTSAYELLEDRLGLSIRLFGASMFLIMRLVWMSLLIYLAAKAMSFMMYGNVAAENVRTIVLITGTVSVFYASIGGLRAVVITDFIQTVLLFGGALLVIAMVTYDFGGFSWFPTQWHDHWDSQPVFSFDPKVRITMFGSLISVFVWYVCTAGGDQVSVQRFMSTSDAKAARKALATQLSVSVIVQLTLGLVGFAILAFYLSHQDSLPEGATVKESADQLFPLFIANELPVGISGLVVAAMFAAAMSSVDSGVNSITAVVTSDFLDRFGISPKTEAKQVLMARILAFTVGAIVVSCSSYMDHIEGNITTVTNKTVNLLTPPLFALFVFALFIPLARPLGVWIGTISAIVVALIMAFSGALVVYLAEHYQIDPATFGTEIVTSIDPETKQEVRTAQDPISFQWLGITTLLVNLGVGTAASWVISKAYPKRES